MESLAPRNSAKDCLISLVLQLQGEVVSLFVRIFQIPFMVRSLGPIGVSGLAFVECILESLLYARDCLFYEAEHAFHVTLVADVVQFVLV